MGRDSDAEAEAGVTHYRVDANRPSDRSVIVARRSLQTRIAHANHLPSLVPYSSLMNFCMPSSALRVYG